MLLRLLKACSTLILFESSEDMLIFLEKCYGLYNLGSELSTFRGGRLSGITTLSFP
jgi:hypothetical protein